MRKISKPEPQPFIWSGVSIALTMFNYDSDTIMRMTDQEQWDELMKVMERYRELEQIFGITRD